MTGQPPRPDTPRGVEARARRDPNTREWTWRYRVRWKDPVTGARCVEEFDTVDEALDYKAQLRLLRRRGQLADLDRGRETLAAFAGRWLHEWAAVNLTHRTLKLYAGTFNLHILPRLGNVQLRHITPERVDKLKIDLAAAGVGAPTIRKVLTILQSILREAVVWGEIKVNPVAAVRKPPAGRTKVITPLTVEQVEQILDHLATDAGPAERMLAELIAYGAARPQDALALPWANVGTQRLVYAAKVVDGEILAGAKTGADRSRSVTMLKALRTDLLRYRLEQGNPAAAALVVPGTDGRPWSDSDYRRWATKHARGRKSAKTGQRTGRPGPFARAAAAAGVPGITPYFLRHTYASLRLAEQKLSLQEIAAEMGHTVEVLAGEYAHVISEYRGQGPIDPDQLIADVRAKRAGGTATRQTRSAT